MSDDFSSKERNNDLNIENSKTEEQTSYITMKIVAFLNARHYMVFADKKGKPHGHSWQLQAEARVPVKYNSFIKFEDLDKLLNKLLAPYQRNVLNDISPFDIIEPLTENITVYFFNALYDALENLDVDLVRLSVWENPTKGIEITERLPQYFSSHDNKAVSASVIEKTLKEVAFSVDNDDSLSSSPSPSNLEQDINQIITGILSGDEPVSEALVSTNDIIPEHTQPSEAIDEVNGEKMVASGNASPSGSPAGIMENIKTRLKIGSSSVEEETEHSAYPLWQILLAILIISGVAIWAYWPLLNAPLYKVYPWGSDTWGHLFKAQFLYREILNGNYYPQFMADWYNGCQPFRYWAPLPYYLLALINHFTKNIFVAGNYYIFFCALLGGTGCLLLARRIGLWPAVMLGIIWLIWPDNVRIALSEGNLPRVLATGFLPLLFYAFMETVKGKKRVWPLLVTLVIIHVVILCHAMIGAVYIIGLSIFGFLWWLFGGCGFRNLVYGMGAIVLGVMSSAWWLLPSLKGGLTSMGTGATGGIQYIAANISFNPFFRFSTRDEFYWGIALLIITIIAMSLWRKKPAWAKGLLITGVFLVLLTFPAFSWLHQLLPLSNILWPLRFSTFASFALLAGGLAISIPYLNQLKQSQKKYLGILLISIFVILLLDSYYSLNTLMITSVEPYHMVDAADSIKQKDGWRTATLDLSSMGSAPSYLFSINSEKEQVFGWAWQGATTSRNIMLLNTALEYNWYPFLFRELEHLGATDLMAHAKSVKRPASFKQMALSYGYSEEKQIADVSLWHKEVSPYMCVRDKSCLAVGKHASTYAMLFPSIEIGKSRKIDSYSVNELNKYKMLILTGAEWQQQDEAEKRIRAYAKSGGKVVVDFTGFPLDVMAKQPKFLGIYAEPVLLKHQLVFNSPEETVTCNGFANDYSTWKTYAPQALDEVLMSYKYYGNSAAAWGYKEIEGNKVWFLGGNPAYHAFLTGDPIAIKMLQQLLGLLPDYRSENTIPIDNYQTNTDGYSMSYSLLLPREVIIPVANLEGLHAYIDNQPVKTNSYENLVCMTLPAGNHRIDFKLINPPIYKVGLYISISIAIILIFGLGSIYWLRRS